MEYISILVYQYTHIIYLKHYITYHKCIQYTIHSIYAHNVNYTLYYIIYYITHYMLCYIFIIYYILCVIYYLLYIMYSHFHFLEKIIINF